MKNFGSTLYLGLAIVLLVLDRWTKHLVASTMELYSHEDVVPGLFRLYHTRNTGIAFSLFDDAGPLVKEWILPAVGVLAVGFIIYLFFQTAASAWLTRLSLALIFAGALGNLYDRIVFGYVTDFLDVYVNGHHWPAFNVADSAISVGAVLLLLTSLRGTHHEKENAKTGPQEAS